MHQALNEKLFLASKIGVNGTLADICRNSDFIEFDVMKTFFGKQDCGSFENRKPSVCFFRCIGAPPQYFQPTGLAMREPN
ncbi:MAG TPA: hypothetical protein PKI71_03315 [Candidatus Rifleibacterium sp.]|nr:hypothetical protein [Candidatus Rifleibacterium sp.]